MFIKGLLYLGATIRNSSIKQAADKNGIKASNLSRLLKDLERKLGVQLLIRKSNGVIPTYAGSQVYQMAKELEQSLLSFNALSTTSDTERVRVFFSEDCFFNIDTKKDCPSYIKMVTVSDIQDSDLAVLVGKKPQLQGYIIKEHNIDKGKFNIKVKFAIKNESTLAFVLYKILLASMM